MKHKNYKAFSASFRIIGQNLPFKEIENNLNLEGTYKHQKGDKRGNQILQDDRWILESVLPEQNEISEHLEWLWQNLSAKKDFLISLKTQYHLDIFVGYRSDSDHGGTVITSSSINICCELDIPLELSIITA